LVNASADFSSIFLAAFLVPLFAGKSSMPAQKISRPLTDFLSHLQQLLEQPNSIVLIATKLQTACIDILSRLPQFSYLTRVST
jgi:hypothetical protein